MSSLTAQIMSVNDDQDPADRALAYIASAADARERTLRAHESQIRGFDAHLRSLITQARDAGCTVEEIAEVLGKSRPWVYAYMKEADR